MSLEFLFVDIQPEVSFMKEQRGKGYLKKTTREKKRVIGESDLILKMFDPEREECVYCSPSVHQVNKQQGKQRPIKV